MLNKTIKNIIINDDQLENELNNLTNNITNIDINKHNYENKNVIKEKKNKSTKNKIINNNKLENELLNKLTNKKTNINLDKKVSNDDKDKINTEYTNKIDVVEIKIINDIKSNTAKNGYKEEDNVCSDLNNNQEIKHLFENFMKKKYSNTFKKHDDKKSKIDISNDEHIFIQVKKYKKNQFGQLDRHWISDIIKYIPLLKSIENMLIDMCEYPLKKCGIKIDKTKQIKKLNNDNYNDDELTNLLNTLNNNKKLILEYVFFGTNNNVPKYICGIEYDNKNNRKSMIIYNIEDIIKYLEQYNFIIKKSHTVIELGNCISFQRKGGDNGNKSSNQLQTKLIFSNINIENKLIYFF